MRVTSLFAFAALAVAPAVFASPAPEGTVDVAQTSVDLDSSKDALDRGDITLHITRTDDLFADHDDNTRDLLMSRFSHIKLAVQLDTHAGCLRVNDQELPLTGEPNGQASLAYVKAEALRMPLHHPTCMLTSAAMEKLEAEMSPGIVGLEVRLEAEIDDLSSTPAAGGGPESQDIDVSVRRIGVFIKITEVEGLEEHQLVHSSFVYAPVLQLLVKSHQQDGSTVTEVSTIAVNGHAPVQMLPAPPMFGGLAQPPKPYGHHGHHRLGFIGRLARLLGLDYGHPQSAKGCPSPPSASPPPPPPHHLGLAGAGRGPLRNSMATANNARPHGPHPHPPPPAPHGCFPHPHRRPSAALVYTGSVLAALWSTIFCKALAGILTIGLLFHVVRRVVLLVRRKRQQRQEVALDEYEYDHVVLFDQQEDKKDAQIVDMSDVVPESNDESTPPPYTQQQH